MTEWNVLSDSERMPARDVGKSHRRSTAPSTGERDRLTFGTILGKIEEIDRHGSVIDSIVQDELTTVEPAMIARLKPRDDRSGRFGGRGRAGTRKGEAAMPFADQDLARRVEEAWVLPGRGERAGAGPAGPGVGGDGAAGGRRIRGVHGRGLAAVAGAGGGPVRAGRRRGARADGELLPRAGAPIQMELASLADSSLLGLLSRRGYRAVEQTHVLVRPLGSREPAAEVRSPATRAGPTRPGPGSRSSRSGRARWRPGPSRCSAASSTGRTSCPARSWKAPSRWPRSPW